MPEYDIIAFTRGSEREAGDLVQVLRALSWVKAAAGPFFEGNGTKFIKVRTVDIQDKRFMLGLLGDVKETPKGKILEQTAYWPSASEDWISEQGIDG